jgi:hypothetical protein
MSLLIVNIIILIINILLWVFCFKIFKKSFSVDGLLSKVKKSADNILKEITGETDNAITLMIAKINDVKEIIEIADKKIMMYENTLIKKENERQLYQQLTEFQQGAPSQQAVKIYSFNDTSDNSELLPLFTENAGTSDLKKSKAMKKNPYAVNKNDNSAQNLELDFSETNEKPKIQQTEKIQPKIPIQDQIIDLARQGLTPDLIASKLNLSISEVSMTIDLFL